MSSESECLVGRPPNESQLLVFKTSILASSLREYLSNGFEGSQRLSTATEVYGPNSHKNKHELKAISTYKNNGITLVDEMLASMSKMTYKFTLLKPKILETLLCSHGFKEAENYEKCNFIWTNQYLEPAFYKSLLPFQRINHFPSAFELTWKDRLYQNIRNMQEIFGMKHFEIVPKSFILPLEYGDLVQAHHSDQQGTWIVKPTSAHRGQGIYLVNTPEQITSDDKVVVSKYVSDPFCINGHKFDIRLFVLVTSFDPLVFYLYEDGLVRFAAAKYDNTPENLWNPFIHTCNYSTNKFHFDYIDTPNTQEDIVHKWTFSRLLKHLKDQGNNTTVLMQAIEDLIVKTIIACTPPILSECKKSVPYRNNCFALYGFDILIDSAIRPWLLEVNLSPSLKMNSQLDAKLKTGIAFDLLTLIGIPAENPNKPVNFNGIKTTKQADYFGGNGLISELSAEEELILRDVQAQSSRRGGFIRIFPTRESMRRYGMFLDQNTGVPKSMDRETSPERNQNLNLMLHTQLYNGSHQVEENGIEGRMKHYEKLLIVTDADRAWNNLLASLESKSFKSLELQSQQAENPRELLQKAIECGSELTVQQARKMVFCYLTCVEKRLIGECQSQLETEQRHQLEKAVLKFIMWSDPTMKLPSFMNDPNFKIVPAKERVAIVTKLLDDFLEAFDRYTDLNFDNNNNNRSTLDGLFDEFVAQATKDDLEFMLTLYVNVSKNYSILYNQSTSQTTPPAALPLLTDDKKFLQALGNATLIISTHELTQVDTYYSHL